MLPSRRRLWFAADGMPKLSIRGYTLEKKFADLLGAVELCFHARHTTPGLVLLYSGMDVASWVWSPNPAAKVKQRFVQWVDRYMKPRKSLGCTALELYSARCAVIHNFSSESDLTRKGSARQVLYAKEPSEVGVLRGRSVESLGYVGVGIESLVAAFRDGLAEMFAESKSTEALAKRLRMRESKVLQTISDEDGRALFDWGERLLAVAEAPQVEFSDSEGGDECELGVDCPSPAAVLIRGIDGQGRILAQIHGCKLHTESWTFSNVIDRRKPRQTAI